MQPSLEAISKNHNRKKFDCGNAALNTFLQNQARQSDSRELVRTKVLVDKATPTEILAFYSTNPCEIPVPQELRAIYGANYPHLVPFLRLSRMATDVNHRGQGHGELCLMSAIADVATIHGATAMGGLIVDAKDETAAAFYKNYGFLHVEPDSLSFFLPIQECICLAQAMGIYEDQDEEVPEQE